MAIITEECITKATISTRHNLPWMSKNIRANIGKRNSVYRKQETHLDLYGRSIY